MRFPLVLVGTAMLAIATPVSAEDPGESATEKVTNTLSGICNDFVNCEANGLMIGMPVAMDANVCSGVYPWTSHGMYGIVEVRSCGKGFFTGWGTEG